MRRGRAQGTYTTTFYNERCIGDLVGEKTRPIWKVQVSSMIVRPREGQVVRSGRVKVEEWAWSDGGVERVDACGDNVGSWQNAIVEKRVEYGW